MRKRFKRSLFGYNILQVDEYIKNTRPDEEAYKKIDQLLSENSKLAVELKIARSGYVEAAELMQQAHKKAMALENELKNMSIKFQESEKQMESQKDEQDFAEKLAYYKARIEELEKKSSQTLLDFIGEVDKFQSIKLSDGTIIEDISFTLPKGMEESVLENGGGNDARKLMRKIYRIRATAKSTE